MEIRYKMVDTERSPPDCLLAVSTFISSSSLNLTLQEQSQHVKVTQDVLMPW